MDPMLLRIFQRQVEDQCDFVLLAHDDLLAAVSDTMQARGVGTREARIAATRHVWFSIQSLLTAAANLSKAFWGEQGELGSEREPLRRSLGVQDGSPLSPIHMGTNFEHIDRWLDRWWQRPEHTYVDKNVGPLGREADVADVFRSFDPGTAVCTFWGDTFRITEILEEVTRILPVVRVEAAKPHWEP